MGGAMTGYNAWARQLTERKPRLAGLWLMTIGLLSCGAQYAIATQLRMYSRVGVFLAPLIFTFGLWMALAGRPAPQGGKAPFWYQAGLGVCLTITAAACAALVHRL
jgi:hypothetical protein